MDICDPESEARSEKSIKNEIQLWRREGEVNPLAGVSGSQGDKVNPLAGVRDRPLLSL